MWYIALGLFHKSEAPIATREDLEELKIELIRGITAWTVGGMIVIAAVVWWIAR